MKRLVWAAALLAAGCGGGAGDLLSLSVSGGPTGAKHTVVVTGDGRGSCDRGPLKQLPSQRVIDARVIEHDAADLAKRAPSYPAAPGAANYTLHTKAGEVTWGAAARGLPPVLPKAELLALQLDRLLCR